MKKSFATFTNHVDKTTILKNKHYTHGNINFYIKHLTVFKPYRVTALLAFVAIVVHAVTGFVFVVNLIPGLNQNTFYYSSKDGKPIIHFFLTHVKN